MQRIIISVTNDLVNDQRVKKVSKTLNDLGFEIILIGRKLSNSLPIARNYKTIRFNLIFNKGFLFYAEYNLRLFFKLLFLKKDILLANDLDSLLPNFIISKIYSKKLVYDSHEVFTEVPELVSRPKIRNIWLRIEEFIFPKLKNVYTVNHKIADFYTKKYKVPVGVIRNIAPKVNNLGSNLEMSKKLKGNKNMLILQGTGINKDRGAEEAVLMMKYLKNTILYIIGSGDVFENLKKIAKANKLENKIIIKNKMPYNQLLEYTKVADLGLSLDKGTNLNYEYSLPNKVFDYIQCQTPIFSSNREVIAGIIKKYNIGFVTKTHHPKELASEIDYILNDKTTISKWNNNLKKIANKYTWEKESKNLQNIFSNLK
mgnify:CR=1 FL=1